LEAVVGTDLVAELAAGAAVEEERIAVAHAVRVLGHDQHARRADLDAQHAALAGLDVDRDGRGLARHLAPALTRGVRGVNGEPGRAPRSKAGSLASRRHEACV